MAKKQIDVSPKVISRVIGVVFTIVGVFAMILGTTIYNKTSKEQSKCTATATAEIIRYDKTVTKNRTGTKKNRPRTNKTTATYAPVYEFTVEGNVYTGTDSFNSSSSKPYDVGTLIEIHYEPENPDNNYLLPISPAVKYGSLAGGGFFTLIGVLGLAGVLAGKNR